MDNRQEGQVTASKSRLFRSKRLERAILIKIGWLLLLRSKYLFAEIIRVMNLLSDSLADKSKATMTIITSRFPSRFFVFLSENLKVR